MKNRHANRSIQIGFLVSIILSFLISLLLDSSSAVEMQFHDTYVVLPLYLFIGLLIFPFIFYFLFHSVMILIRRQTNPLLSKIHYYVSAFSTLFLFGFFYISTSRDFIPRRYFSYHEYEPILTFSNSFFTPLIIYLTIQFCFFFYFIFTTKKLEN